MAVRSFLKMLLTICLFSSGLVSCVLINASIEQEIPRSVTATAHITTTPDIKPSASFVVDPKAISTLRSGSENNQHINIKAGDDYIVYFTQSGDTLKAIARHFGVNENEIQLVNGFSVSSGFLDPGHKLIIPRKLMKTTPSEPLLPDSEVIYSISATDFNIRNYCLTANSYLSNYLEAFGDDRYWGDNILAHIALNSSINPRLMTALLEFQSQWIYGKPDTRQKKIYPAGFISPEHEGLYLQLKWATSQLNTGYYGWRDGTINELVFPDNTRLRIAPTLNAGSVAIQYLFSKIYNYNDWYNALYGENNLIVIHTRMFGDPWERAKRIGPLIPGNLEQPSLVLPFQPGRKWNYTGGPHVVWGNPGAIAAIDFAPTGVKDCQKSDEWITAAASGLVVRSGEGIVSLDLDGDGYEQTGWNLFYLHVASRDRAQLGTYLNQNDPLGHPSCEGGLSTGTHVHLGRKYNGEWIIADDAVPFILSGWRIRPGIEQYQGTMQKGNSIIPASRVGEAESLIIYNFP